MTLPHSGSKLIVCLAEETEQRANDTLSQLAAINTSLTDLDTKLGSVCNSVDEENQHESGFRMDVTSKLDAIHSKLVVMNDSMTETLGCIKNELVESSVSEPAL